MHFVLSSAAGTLVYRKVTSVIVIALETATLGQLVNIDHVMLGETECCE